MQDCVPNPIGGEVEVGALAVAVALVAGVVWLFRTVVAYRNTSFNFCKSL